MLTMNLRHVVRHVRRLAPVAFGGTLILLNGCAVGPDYVEPEYAVPDAWENAASEDVQGEAPVIENWWSAMGDTHLDSLIVRARQANPDLAGAIARIREARAYHQIAGGDYYPQMQGTGSFARTQIAENGPQGGLAVGGNNPGNNWEFGLGASWEVDVFGRVRRTREATGAQVAASIEDYRDVMVSLYAEVATTYVDIRALQMRLSFARNNVASQRETMDIVIAREDAGLVPLLDVTRARSNLANTEAAIPQLATGLEASLNQMAILLGEMPGALDEEMAPLEGLKLPSTEVAVALPAELLRRRPDVRRSERNLAAQNALIGVATADLYPSFSLTGVLNLTSVTFDGLSESGHTGWSLVPGVKWNLFTGGKIRGQIKAEEAKTQQALAFYEMTVLRALAEVENSLVALRQEEIRYGLLTTAVEASQQSVELVQIQYLEGLTDFQSYLDAQRVLFDQQDQYARSRGQVVTNLIDLNRSLGGGWSLAETAPDVADDLARAEQARQAEADTESETPAGDTAQEEEVE
ncbi:MAG: efflux transporter outer membrane subunit [Candidatus Krumholzibacteria bacterium]|nr:efflux transporter outer membrane subunit [Candidatus Krumholzibacteria bacterium]